MEEGVIEKSELLHEPTKVVDATDIADYSPDVIGHLQTDKGHNLGNVVCDSLFRPSRKTKCKCAAHIRDESHKFHSILSIFRLLQ